MIHYFWKRRSLKCRRRSWVLDPFVYIFHALNDNFRLLWHAKTRSMFAENKTLFKLSFWWERIIIKYFKMILNCLLEVIFKSWLQLLGKLTLIIATLHFIICQKIRAVNENSKENMACKICLYICIYSYISYKKYLRLPMELITMEKNYVIKHKICKGLSHLDHFTQPKLKSHI